MPRLASAPSFHCVVEVGPSGPVIRIGARKPVLWKPVPKMIVSAGCSFSRGDDAFGGHPLDPSGDDPDVRLQQRRIPVVGDQDPLAPDRVVGDERLPGEVVRHHLLEPLRNRFWKSRPTREPDLEMAQRASNRTQIEAR